MSGLLIDGEIVPVPGVTIINSNDAAWAHLDAGDGCSRGARRPQQITLHKTLADDPEHLLPGAGPPGHAERDARYWAADPQHGGAHLVTGDDGVVACLADLVRWCAYHARSVNFYSVGIETCEKLGGGFYEAAAHATVEMVGVIAEHIGIQLQFPRLGTYKGQPLRRMANGGPTCIGVFGHCHNDDARSKWDPGEILFTMVQNRWRAEAFDFDAGEDLEVWKKRQADLNARGHQLVVDGIPGPATTAALKAEGYRGGVWALGRG